MSRLLCTVVLVAFVGAIAAGFYFGLFTISGERVGSDYAVSLMIHPDVLVTHSTHSGTGRVEEQTLEAKGTIASVNTSAREFAVIVDGQGGERSFRLADDGKVLINDQLAKLSDLRAGNQVTVIYRIDEDEWVATAVHCIRRS